MIFKCKNCGKENLWKGFCCVECHDEYYQSGKGEVRCK